jgi:hypothetical protein
MESWVRYVERWAYLFPNLGMEMFVKAQQCVANSAFAVDKEAKAVVAL